MTRTLATVLFVIGLCPLLAAQTSAVSHLTMNQWVRVDDVGSLSGRIAVTSDSGVTEAVADVYVVIVGRDGAIRRAKTDARGEFLIRNVASGIYALTARGENLFACCALHVLNDFDGADFPNELHLTAARLNYSLIGSAIVRYLPSNVSRADISLDLAQLDSLASRVCGEDLFRVAQKDGGMSGRILSAGAVGDLLSGSDLANVFVFDRTSDEVARAVTDEEGRFSIDSLSAGHYSLLAIGLDGIGVIGFELVGQAGTDQALRGSGRNESERLVAKIVDETNGELEMQLAPPDVVEIVADPCVGCGPDECAEGLCPPECCGIEVIEDPIPEDGFIIDGPIVDGVGTPISGGGVGGGGGGTGGFGGGGGGGIGAAAALAAVGASIGGGTNGGTLFAPIIASDAAPN